MNPSGPCPRRAGFLFPHPCERASPIGCPECQEGKLTDPYRERADRYGYTDYDDYRGYSQGGSADFTEADGEHLVKRRKAFEDDMTAS